MNKLALLLLIVAVDSPCFAQNAKTPASSAKLAQSRPIEITAVDSRFATWSSQFSSVNAWGVRIRIENTTDIEVSESVAEGDLRVVDASGKQFGISDQYQNLYAVINLAEMRGQGLDGAELFSPTGSDAVIIRNGGTKIGEFSRTIDTSKVQNIYTIKLAPRKSVTLVFVFDSTMKPKPQTLFWGKVKPLDLR